MKTNPSSAQIIESERIIKRDGFSYFLIPDD
jgi:ribosomal protein L36